MGELRGRTAARPSGQLSAWPRIRPASARRLSGRGLSAGRGSGPSRRPDGDAPGAYGVGRQARGDLALLVGLDRLDRQVVRVERALASPRRGAAAARRRGRRTASAGRRAARRSPRYESSMTAVGYPTKPDDIGWRVPRNGTNGPSHVRGHDRGSGACDAQSHATVSRGAAPGSGRRRRGRGSRRARPRRTRAPRSTASASAASPEPRGCGTTS